MQRFSLKALSQAVILFAITCCSRFANGQSNITSVASDPKLTSPTADEMLQRVDLLVHQNEQLEKQNRELMNVIAAMRRVLAEQSHASQVDVMEPPINASMVESVSSTSSSSGSAGVRTANDAPGQEQSRRWGTYTPNLGFKLANTEYGDVNLSIYSYARYLNQRNLQPTYTSAFGVTTTLQQRQDFQLQKVQMKFLGWVMNPKFRYFLYAWSSNASQGLGAQVVISPAS